MHQYDQWFEPYSTTGKDCDSDSSSVSSLEEAIGAPSDREWGHWPSKTRKGSRAGTQGDKVSPRTSETPAVEDGCCGGAAPHSLGLC